MCLESRQHECGDAGMRGAGMNGIDVDACIPRSNSTYLVTVGYNTS